LLKSVETFCTTRQHPGTTQQHRRARPMAPLTKGALLALMGSAAGWKPFQAEIPNGDRVMKDGSAWAGVGHNARGGAGVLNSFGDAFLATNKTWTAALCAQDSDGDGQSNGLELGDPDCTWSKGSTPARTTDVSHPGFSDSKFTAGRDPAPSPAPSLPQADDSVRGSCVAGLFVPAAIVVAASLV